MRHSCGVHSIRVFEKLGFSWLLLHILPAGIGPSTGHELKIVIDSLLLKDAETGRFDRSLSHPDTQLFVLIFVSISLSWLHLSLAIVDFEIYTITYNT